MWEIHMTPPISGKQYETIALAKERVANWAKKRGIQAEFIQTNKHYDILLNGKKSGEIVRCGL